MLIDTVEELLSGSSLSYDSFEGKKSGGFVVPIEESKILGDLLMNVLRYDPKKRMNVEAVLEHSWFER